MCDVTSSQTTRPAPSSSIFLLKHTISDRVGCKSLITYFESWVRDEVLNVTCIHLKERFYSEQDSSGRKIINWAAVPRYFSHRETISHHVHSFGLSYYFSVKTQTMFTLCYIVKYNLDDSCPKWAVYKSWSKTSGWIREHLSPLKKLFAQENFDKISRK